MIDSDGFIIIALLVVFGFIGLVAWFVDQGAAQKYRRVVLYGLFGALASVFGLFFLIEDDSDFEYAGPNDYAQKEAPEKSGESPFGGGGDDGGGAGGGGEGEAGELGDEEGELGGEGDVAGGEDGGEGDTDGSADVADADEKAKDENKKCESCPEMVRISAGEAILGSPVLIEAGGASTGPSLTLEVKKAFSISKFETTVGEYRAFVEATGYKSSKRCRQVGKRSANATWRSPGFKQTDEHPVVCVSWHDATNYAVWLSKISGHKYRLPTEVEWEYAARSGISDAYITGRTIEHGFANFDASSGGQAAAGTRPVGEFPANAFGVHDVHGNVWEMVRDCWAESYDVANAAPVAGAARAKNCKKRVIKGGGWFSSAKQLNFAMRIGVGTKFASNGVGFRVVRKDK